MKTKTKGRKFLSVLVALSMACSMLIGFGTASAEGEGISFDSGWIIYANGNAIIIDKAGDNGAANVYLDKNRNGAIDADESTPVVLTDFTAKDGGYDLSGAMVFGGSFTDPVAGDTKITMLGGDVDMVYGGGLAGAVSGDTYVIMTGGICGYIYGGGAMASVRNTNIEIGGTAKVIQNSNGNPGQVYGGGQQDNCTVTGNVNITVKDQAEINQLCGGSSGQGNGDYNVHGDVTICLNGGTINQYVSPGANVQASVNGTGKVVLDGGTVKNIYGTDEGYVKNVVVEIKSGTVMDSVLPINHGNAESAVIDLSGGNIGGYVFSDGNGGRGTLGSMALNLSGRPAFSNPKKGIVLREGQTATVTGELTGEPGSIHIYPLVTVDGTVLVYPESAAQNGYLDYSKFKLVNVDGKAVIPGTGEKENTLVISHPVDTQNATVAAKSTIPEPTYTVTIPATVDAGTLEKKEAGATDAVKSTSFTVSASNVANLFGKKITVFLASSFELAETDGSTKLNYSVYAPDSSTPLASGAKFVEFTANGDKIGTLAIDQSQITKEASYSGTLTFTIALTEGSASK